MILKRVSILRTKIRITIGTNIRANRFGFSLIELILIIGIISLCIYSMVSSLGINMNTNTDFYARLLVRDIHRFYEKAYLSGEIYYLEFREDGYIIKGIEDNDVKEIRFGDNIRFRDFHKMNCITFYDVKKNINENSTIVIEDENTLDYSVITIVPTTGRLTIKK